jgi:hypothetical protein
MSVRLKPNYAKAPARPGCNAVHLSGAFGRDEAFRVFSPCHKKPCGDDTPQSLIELES